MRSKTVLILLAAGLAAAGCTTRPVDRGQIMIATPTPPTDPAPRMIPLADLTYDALDSSNEPLILATMDDGARVMTLTPGAETEDLITWVSSEGQSFQFNGAQIVATENLGADLMAIEQDADTDVASTDPYRRDYHHSDGSGLRVTRATCTMADPVDEEIEILQMAYQTSRLDETCTGLGAEPIQNAYWVGEDGTLWQSRQWVSAELGFLDLKRLIR